MRVFRGMGGVAPRPDFQLHHILPVGVFAHANFAASFDMLRLDGFDPRFYAINGLFLPSTEDAAMRWRLPMHRGPHRRYNDLVATRVSAITRALEHRYHSPSARYDAIARFSLLIGALRRNLAGAPKGMLLNRRDPFNSAVSFVDLDQACDILWAETK